MTAPRSRQPSDEGPWCWQAKAVRRKIRDAFDATNNVATALAVYDALTEIASDEGAETFTTTHAWIQRMSGVSVSTVKKHLSVFADMSIVRISTPALRAPSTYVLLSLANGCLSSANGGLALANAPQSGPLATSEERSEEREKNEGEKTPALAPYSVPWLSLPALPADLRAFAIDTIGGEIIAAEAYDEIVGRKLKFGDTQPSAGAWAAVIRAELRDAASKQPKHRHAAVVDGSDPDPEPPGWQAFVDEHLDGPHATGGIFSGPWETKDYATRAQIRRLMSEHQQQPDTSTNSAGGGQAA